MSTSSIDLGVVNVGFSCLVRRSFHLLESRAVMLRVMGRTGKVEMIALVI